jgi:hypothetical protein
VTPDGAGSSDVHPAHVAELLAWVAARPRTYAEAIEAWRTSCPRLSAWDDALTAGLLRVEPGGASVALTPRGRAALDAARVAAGP